ncbi:hypothetical protein H7F33_13080 [Pedobacter sp. PAMC26386]|nr:hypothetical protein H7F33_13080 [Pedobacter sp. PAMC26386]
MKKNTLTAKVLVFFLSLAFIYTGCKNSSSKTSVVVNETRDQYQLAIDYDKTKTDSVEHYLSRFIGQDAIFTPEHTSAIHITMADQTIFDVKSTPGEFRLTFDKSKNSSTALNRIKTINKELEPILK